MPWRLDWWEREHPVLQPFSDPQYGDLQRLAFRGFTELKPGEGTKVLARFHHGSPALAERSYGRGKVLWFASSCDRQWSDWPRSRLFVPVVHQLVGYLAGLAEGGPIRLRRTDEFELREPAPEPGVYDRGGFVEVVNVDPRNRKPAGAAWRTWRANSGLFRRTKKPLPTQTSPPPASSAARSGRTRSGTGFCWRCWRYCWRKGFWLTGPRPDVLYRTRLALARS